MANTDVKSTLEGLTYPSEKQDIVQYARGKGANMEAVGKLENLPDRQYEGVDDVMSELGSGTEDDAAAETEPTKM